MQNEKQIRATLRGIIRDHLKSVKHLKCDPMYFTSDILISKLGLDLLVNGRSHDLQMKMNALDTKSLQSLATQLHWCVTNYNMKLKLIAITRSMVMCSTKFSSDAVIDFDAERQALYLNATGVLLKMPLLLLRTDFHVAKRCISGACHQIIFGKEFTPCTEEDFNTPWAREWSVQ